jgi:hypothetical protein
MSIIHTKRLGNEIFVCIKSKNTEKYLICDLDAKEINEVSKEEWDNRNIGLILSPVATQASASIEPISTLVNVGGDDTEQSKELFVTQKLLKEEHGNVPRIHIKGERGAWYYDPS